MSYVCQIFHEHYTDSTTPPAMTTPCALQTASTGDAPSYGGHASSLPGAPPIVDHRNTMHTAILGQIVGDGIVLSDTIIPHRHRPTLPAEADLKLGLVDVVEQRRQEALTVAAGHPQHMRGEMAIDIEKRLPGHRVVGNDRMHGRPHSRHALVETFETALGEKLIPVGARRMHSEEVAQIG